MTDPIDEYMVQQMKDYDSNRADEGARRRGHAPRAFRSRRNRRRRASASGLGATAPVAPPPPRRPTRTW